MRGRQSAGRMGVIQAGDLLAGVPDLEAEPLGAVGGGEDRLYGGGNVAARLAQGAVFGLVLGAAVAGDPEDGQRLVVSALLLVVGVLLLVTAAKKWRKEEDPDAPPPRWMAAVGGLSAVGAVGAGALLVAVAVKQWVFTLSAIALIGEAGLGRGASIGMYLAYASATQALVLLPILAYVAAPQRAAAEGGGDLAGAAQSGDIDNRVAGLRGVVLVQGRHGVDRLTLAMTQASQGKRSADPR